MASMYFVFLRLVVDMPPKDMLHPAMALVAIRVRVTSPFFNFPMFFLVFLV